jgi:hypothetical protein
MYSPSTGEIEEKLTRVLDELYILRGEIKRYQADVQREFKSLDLKKTKRNRTTKNRCKFHNDKKNKPCSGYICKSSDSLCYAHHYFALHPDEKDRKFSRKNALDDLALLAGLEPPDLETVELSGKVALPINSSITS